MNGCVSGEEREVLFSQTFICAENDSRVHIDFDFMPEYNLNVFFDFEFYEDKKVNNGEPKLEIEYLDGGVLFKLYNGENAFGTGNKNAIPIAVLGGRRTYLYFRFSRPEQGMPRLFTYTLVIDREGQTNE